jgi:hypothetical protein
MTWRRAKQSKGLQSDTEQRKAEQNKVATRKGKRSSIRYVASPPVVLETWPSLGITTNFLAQSKAKQSTAKQSIAQQSKVSVGPSRENRDDATA